MNKYIVGKALNTWKDTANVISLFPVLDPPGIHQGILVMLSKAYDDLGIYSGKVRCHIYARKNLEKHYSDHREDELLYNGELPSVANPHKLPAPSKFLKRANCYFPRSRR